MVHILRILALLFNVSLLLSAAPTMAQTEDPADKVLETLGYGAAGARLSIEAGKSVPDVELFKFNTPEIRDPLYKGEIRKIPLEERKAFRKEYLDGRKSVSRTVKVMQWADGALGAAELALRTVKPLMEGNWEKVAAESLAFVSGEVVSLAIRDFGGFVCKRAGVAAAVGGTPLSGVAVYGTCTGIFYVGGAVAGILVDKAVTDGMAAKGKGSDGAPRKATGAPAGVRARLGGVINLNVRTEDVNTTATGESTAITEIGVARGDGDAEVNAVVKGTTTTRAEGESTAITKIGVAEGGDARINVTVDGPVTTKASGKSNATTEVGVSTGGDVNARVDSVTTTATGRSDAAATVGAASGGGQADVRIKGGVTTSATGRASAENRVGVGNDGGRANARIGGGANSIASGSGSASNRVGIADGGRANARVSGSVNAVSKGSGSASNEIGISSGGSSSASVSGSVNTIATGGGNTSTRIGVDSSTSVKNVINKDGDLEIGTSCAARRDGKCCVTIHRRLCVLSVVPTHKGHCPPRYERSGGLCYLYSDKKHNIDK